MKYIKVEGETLSRSEGRLSLCYHSEGGFPNDKRIITSCQYIAQKRKEKKKSEGNGHCPSLRIRETLFSLLWQGKGASIVGKGGGATGSGGAYVLESTGDDMRTKSGRMCHYS